MLAGGRLIDGAARRREAEKRGDADEKQTPLHVSTTDAPPAWFPGAGPRPSPIQALEYAAPASPGAALDGAGARATRLSEL